MSENRVLKIIFGPKREGMMGGWRGLRNEEFHSLYASLCIIKVVKSKSMDVWGM
jgi:hypothetical protein